MVAGFAGCSERATHTTDPPRLAPTGTDSRDGHINASGASSNPLDPDVYEITYAPDGSVASVAAKAMTAIHEEVFRDHQTAVDAAKEAARWQAMATFAAWLQSTAQREQKAVTSDSDAAPGAVTDRGGAHGDELTMWAECPIAPPQSSHFDVDAEGETVTAHLRWQFGRQSDRQRSTKIATLRRTAEYPGWDRFDQKIWADGILVYDDLNLVCGDHGIVRSKLWRADGSIIYDVAVDGSIAAGPEAWGWSRTVDGKVTRKLPLSAPHDADKPARGGDGDDTTAGRD